MRRNLWITHSRPMKGAGVVRRGPRRTSGEGGSARLVTALPPSRPRRCIRVGVSHSRRTKLLPTNTTHSRSPPLQKTGQKKQKWEGLRPQWWDDDNVRRRDCQLGAGGRQHLGACAEACPAARVATTPTTAPPLRWVRSGLTALLPGVRPCLPWALGCRGRQRPRAGDGITIVCAMGWRVTHPDPVDEPTFVSVPLGWSCSPGSPATKCPASPDSDCRRGVLSGVCVIVQPETE